MTSNYAFLILTLIITVGSAVGQADYHREHRLLCIAEDSGMVSFRGILQRVEAHVSSTIASHRALSAAITSPSSAIVSWLGSQGEITVEEFSLQSGQWVGSQVTGGLIAGLGHHHAITYDHIREELIVFDYTTRFLAGTTWRPNAAMPQGNWFIFADTTTHPELEDAILLESRFDWRQSASSPTGRLLRLSPDLRSGHPLEGIEIEGSIFSPSVSRWALAGSRRIPESPPLPKGSSFFEGSLIVQITAAPNQPFEILDANDVVIGTGLNPNGTAVAVPVTLLRPLEVGEDLRVRYVGRDPISTQLVHRSYGVPGTSPATGTSFVAYDENLHPTVGDSGFTFMFRLKDPTPSGTWTALDSVALAGVAQGSSFGFDPIVWVGITAILDLQSVILLPVRAQVDALGNGFVTVSAPVPNDPMVQGAVILFQCAIDDGGGIFYSQVIGLEIGA